GRIDDQRVPRIHRTRQRGRSGGGRHHRRRLRQDRDDPRRGGDHAADRYAARQSGLLQPVPGARSLERHAGVPGFRQGCRRTGCSLRRVSQRRRQLPNRGLRDFPTRQTGEPLEETGGGHHQTVPALPVRNSAQGNALLGLLRRHRGGVGERRGWPEGSSAFFSAVSRRQSRGPRIVIEERSGAPLRIALISPKGPLYRHPGGIFKRSLRYAPLTLTPRASLAPPELDPQVTLVDEGIADVDPNLNADVVGLTVITGTAPRAYELAAGFRRRGIPVVLGGPHVTLVPDDAQPHADSVVVGYAEDTWPELLRDLSAGRLHSRYVQQPGLSLASRPFARRDLLPARRYLTTNVFEATRGCIHNCDFCVVPAAWGRKPYQKPVEDVVADI